MTLVSFATHDPGCLTNWKNARIAGLVQHAPECRKVSSPIAPSQPGSNEQHQAKPIRVSSRDCLRSGACPLIAWVIGGIRKQDPRTATQTQSNAIVKRYLSSNAYRLHAILLCKFKVIIYLLMCSNDEGHSGLEIIAKGQPLRIYHLTGFGGDSGLCSLLESLG